MKFKVVFSILMSFGLSILMTLWVTFINLGFSDLFFQQWAQAFILAWPVAAVTAFVISDPIRNFTKKLLQ